MEFIHIRNLEKYHLDYRDRTLIWCKAYFSMLNADPDFEMLCEIDKWRFIALIMLELQIKKPVPLDKEYLQRKGFNLKTRPIHLTLQMLHTLIEVRNETVTQSRVDKSRVEESRVEKSVSVSDESFIKDLKEKYDYVDVDNELNKMDIWLSLRQGRQKTRRFIVNWLNKIDKPLKIPAPAIKNKTAEKVKAWKEEQEKEAQVDPKELKKLLKDTADKIGSKEAL
jgi:hypothetical protein